MILLGFLLLVLYIFFRHPLLLFAGGTLVIAALVFAIVGGFSHYAYF